LKGLTSGTPVGLPDASSFVDSLWPTDRYLSELPGSTSGKPGRYWSIGHWLAVQRRRL